LNSDRRLVTNQLLEKILDLEPGDYASFLSSLGKDNPDQAKIAEKLIKSIEGSTDFLENSALDYATHLFSELDSENNDLSNSNINIGPFQLLKKIGFGGMGTVYLAQRNDGLYQRKVALKVLSLHISTPELKKQFLYERQILASLDHPNIARLYTGGVWRDEQPWLAMEYIDGLPLDDYCKTNKLSLEDRIHLFIKICDTVHFAHQNLIVHRDLKPSNIMITNDGEPKLLDFGVSKLMSRRPELGITKLNYNTEIFPFSGDYASPEQIRKEKITTSVDIYSLGIILYSLLTGYKPYSTKALSPIDLETTICSKPVKKPSDIVLDYDNALCLNDSISESKKWLSSKLKGDLDTIIQKAIHKDINRRYVSVKEFTDDLKRFLNHEPVLARPDFFGYKTIRYVQRNKTQSFLIASTLIALLISLASISYSFHESNYQRNLALEALAVSENEKLKQAEIASFMTNLFSVDGVHLGNVLAIDLLRRGSEQINSNIINQPELEADIHFTLGIAYTNLGLHTMATDHFGKADSIYSNRNETSDLILADLNYHKAFNSAHLRTPDRGVQALDNLELQLSVFDESHPRVGESLRLVLWALSDSRNITDSYDEYLQRYLNNIRANTELWSVDYIQKYHDYIFFLPNEKAIPLLEKSIPEITDRYGSDFDLLAKYYSTLAEKYNRERVHTEKVIPYYEKAYNINMNWNGESDEFSIQTANTLGVLLRVRSDFEKAEHYFRLAVNGVENSNFKESSRAMLPLLNLGRTLVTTGKHTEAYPYLKKALSLQYEHFQRKNINYAYNYVSLGHVYELNGDINKAFDHFKKAYEFTVSTQQNNPGLIRGVLRLIQTFNPDWKEEDFLS